MRTAVGRAWSREACMTAGLPLTGPTRTASIVTVFVNAGQSVVALMKDRSSAVKGLGSLSSALMVQACAQSCSAVAQHSSSQQARADHGSPALGVALAVPTNRPQSCASQVCASIAPASLPTTSSDMCCQSAQHAELYYNKSHTVQKYDKEGKLCTSKHHVVPYSYAS